MRRWVGVGWPRRLLVLAVVLGCCGIFLLALSLADQRHFSALWQAGAGGQAELQGSALPALKPHVGKSLAAVANATSTEHRVENAELLRSPRWLVDDAGRARQRAAHDFLAAARLQSSLSLTFADGSEVDLAPERRGFGRLGWAFWLLCGLALLLYLSAAVVVIAHPSTRNRLLALMAACQIGNLLLIAAESPPGLGLPPVLAAWAMPMRMAFDLITAAAAMHVASLLRPWPRIGHWGTTGAWLVVGLVVALAAAERLAHAWWWGQAGVTLLGAAAIGLLSQQRRHAATIESTLQLRRCGALVLGAWILLTLAVGLSDGLPGSYLNRLDDVATGWTVLIAMLLLLATLQLKSGQIVREFSLLAAVSSVATSLDLLFVSMFSLGQFTSLTLALFISLAVYAGARHWLLSQFLGVRRLSTERMFEQLYRIAREVEINPQRVPLLLKQLLTDLFEPIQAELVDHAPASSQLADDGATLWVPVPMLSDQPASRSVAIQLRLAQRGRRAFTLEDAQLTDRIVEQLQRAVAFDRAVEQGRTEERQRLAQDLHDDIGARLLTLMYKAQSPEMEEYVRHTLKDLKTLTRGLAAPSHSLSHAAAEWKADLTQRLTAADVELGWNFAYDRDLVLSVVQWSALTRILRELVSNAIAHAGARRVEVAFQLEGDQLRLSVGDDGCGADPSQWSHGLGLSGVRKRVKQLGGEVHWSAAAPKGTHCQVHVRLPPILG